MRLNSYVSGLGQIEDGGFGDPGFDGGYSSPGVEIYNYPSSSNQSAANGWTSLLQSVIGTGVNAAARIAVTQNAVPQLNPGTYYSYNAKTGSTVMGAAAPGQASLISGSSIFSSPIMLLGAGVLAIALIARRR